MNGTDGRGRLSGSAIARLHGRRIRRFRLPLQITDALVLGGLLVQAALFLLFFRRLDRPLFLAAKNAGLAALYLLLRFPAFENQGESPFLSPSHRLESSFCSRISTAPLIRFS